MTFGATSADLRKLSTYQRNHYLPKVMLLLHAQI